jgi:hypothetical protein
MSYYQHRAQLRQPFGRQGHVLQQRLSQLFSLLVSWPKQRHGPGTKELIYFFKPPQHPAFLGILITKCCIASLELRYERIGSGLGFQIVI